MLERTPHNLKAYFAYYKFLKKVHKLDKIDFITMNMMKAIESSTVPTDEWMEAHLVRADALVELKRVDEAIETLEKLVHIIPPLPIPGLSYLSKLEEKRLTSESDPESGTIKFSYDSVSPNERAKTERRNKSEDNDEEEKGMISIKVTPSEDCATDRGRKSISGKNKNGIRNAKPLSSSLFLSTPRGVSS
jgi:tetratricopeptide (TPR) repeat protein